MTSAGVGGEQALSPLRTGTRRFGFMTQASGDRPPQRIVVVGGGAAGLELVTRLGDKLGKRGLADIALLERTALTYGSRCCIWSPRAAWIVPSTSSTISPKATCATFATTSGK